MKALNIILVQDQVDLLSYTVHHSKELGFDSFVIDLSFSNEAEEWLQRHQVPYNKILDSECVDEEIAKLIDQNSPDWVLISKVNEYLVLDSLSVQEVLKSAHEKGFDQIKCRHFDFYHTGENPLTNHPKNHYHYYREGQEKIRLYRPFSTIKGKACLIDAFVLSYEKALVGDQADLDTLFDIRNFDRVKKFIGI